MADVEEMKCRHCGWTIKPIYPMAPEAGYVHVAYGDEPNYQFCKGQGMNAAEPFKLPADASPAEPQEQDEPKCELCGEPLDVSKSDWVEKHGWDECRDSRYPLPAPTAPTAAGSEEPRELQNCVCGKCHYDCEDENCVCPHHVRNFAAEPVASQAPAPTILERIIERANDYREMARVSRNDDNWSAAENEDGVASGLFKAARMIREANHE
jgi:hypothetical protein